MTVVRPGKYTFYCLTNINQQVSVQQVRNREDTVQLGLKISCSIIYP